MGQRDLGRAWHGCFGADAERIDGPERPRGLGEATGQTASAETAPALSLEGVVERRRILLPWSKSCFGRGEDNPRGLRAKLYQVDSHIEMSFVAPRELVGWSNVVHGGLLGTVMDEVMAWAAIVEG